MRFIIEVDYELDCFAMDNRVDFKLIIKLSFQLFLTKVEILFAFICK